MGLLGWKLVQLTAAVLLSACGLRAEVPVAFLTSPPPDDGYLVADASRTLASNLTSRPSYRLRNCSIIFA